jgi:hypothetical protein
VVCELREPPDRDLRGATPSARRALAAASRRRRPQPFEPASTGWWRETRGLDEKSARALEDVPTGVRQENARAAPLEELDAERRFELGICTHGEAGRGYAHDLYGLIAASHVVAVKFAVCRPIVTALYGLSYWKEIVTSASILAVCYLYAT